LGAHLHRKEKIESSINPHLTFSNNKATTLMKVEEYTLSSPAFSKHWNFLVNK